MTAPEELQRIILKQHLVLGEVGTFLSAVGTSNSPYADVAWALYSRVVAATVDAKTLATPSHGREEAE